VDLKFASKYYRTTVYLLALSITWYFFPPVYFKNDDVVMSMISGGYGQMYDKSILLYHSSVIIGFISSKLPFIFGIAPYNFINLAILTLNFIALNELLHKLNKKFFTNFLLAYASSLFILIRPTFTTITGYLCVVGILLIYLFNTNQNRNYLILGFSLFLAASLIRDEMVVLFLAFTCIILIQSFVKNKKDVILFGTIFSLLFGISQLINRQQYNDESLLELTEFEQVRYPIVDYNADKHILQNADALLSNEYSSNDIKLIRNWFFVDPHLNDTSRLKALLNDTQWQGPLINFNLQESLISTGNLITNYPLNFLLISIIILIFFSVKKYNLIILLLFFILTLFGGAMIGRQLEYVYFPLLTFLFIFAYLQVNEARVVAKYLIYSLSLIVILTTLSINKSNKETIGKVNFAYENIKQDKLWVIGGGLPTQFIFPLLGTPNIEPELIASDWSIYAPKSNFVKYNSNNNFISELQSKQGVNVATNNYHLPLIQEYCKEKFGSDLIIKPVIDSNLLIINNLKCLSSKLNIISPSMEYSNSGQGFLWITSEESKFYLINYSSIKIDGTFKLLTQNNPCKKNINYTLNASSFSTSAISSQEYVSFPYALKPYEKILLAVSIRKNQELCKIEGDNRSFVVMFKNSD